MPERSSAAGALIIQPDRVVHAYLASCPGFSTKRIGSAAAALASRACALCVSCESGVVPA